MGAEAFAAAGVVPPGRPGLERQIEAAGWWAPRGDREPSVAVTPPATAASGAGRASAAGVDPLEVSGQDLLVSAAAGRQTVASELEVSLPGSSEESPDQKESSGLEGLPDPVPVAGPQVLG